MIDQLWLCLWIVETREFDPGSDTWDTEHVSSGVVTSFPHTSYPRSDTDPPDLYATADVLQSVFEPLRAKSNRHHEPLKLATSILKNTLLGTLSQDDWSLHFLELFREAIGNVTEKHNELFREFNQSIIPGKKQIKTEQRISGVKLGVEVADIIDELHMLQQLFETQRDVLKKREHPTLAVECLEPL